jgi:hypothetical protein
MTRLTAKSSTIFISSGDTTRVYQSLSDVPPELRRKLEQSTKGSHSATILIADRRGREELVRALRCGAKRSSQSAAAKKATPSRKVDLRGSLAFLIPVLLGVLIWFFIANSF